MIDNIKFKYMITRYIRVLFYFIVFQFASQVLYSQVNTETISSRYLVFQDVKTLFTYSEDNVSIDSFQLNNIMESESSKPIHIAVNDLPGVVKFSIESNSSVYENQRRCKLIMRSLDYINTFRMVLYNMDIDYIIYNGNRIDVEEFLELLKN